MGRPGLSKHRKFIRLTRLLGSALIARGALETLWDAVYENGDDFVGNALDLEGLAQWNLTEGQLASSLLEAGFIDECDDNPAHFRIHDLWQHAPKYVASRHARESAREKQRPCKHCGGIFHTSDIRTLYCSDACRVAAFRGRHSNGSVTDASVTETDSNGSVTDCNDTPSPSPSPSLNTPPTPSKRGNRLNGSRAKEAPLGEYLPGVKEALAELRPLWPKKREGDGSLIRVDPALWLFNMNRILAENPSYTAQVLVDGAKDYLANLPNMAKAPQFFFGAEGPWKAHAMLAAARAKKANEPTEQGATA